MNVGKQQQQKLISFPFNNPMRSSTNNFESNIDNILDGQVESTNFVAPIRSHRLQIRDGSLKFRLNDGNLRIGRGFGKRSGDTNEKYAKISISLLLVSVCILTFPCVFNISHFLLAFSFKEMQNFRRFLYNNPWLFSDDE